MPSFRIFSISLFVVALVSSDSFAQSGESSLSNRIKALKSANETAKTSSGSTMEVKNPLYKTILNSVVLIECAGEDGVHSGTGWIVDAEQRLIITNHHVVEEFLDCSIYFPEFQDGKLVTDPYESIVAERAHHAKVIDVAADYDLALIQLDDALPEGVVALEIASEPGNPGDNIHSVAGNTVGSQSLWTYSTGHIRQFVRGTMANDHEAMLLESDMATNQGNSGGPVVNDAGQVVAVVEGHRTDARLVSIYIGLESLLEYLSDAVRCVDPKTVEDLTFAANRQLDDFRTQPAMELVTKALKLEPNSAELVTLRGWCWYYDDDPDSARADFSDAIQLDRKSAEAHAGLGYICDDEGDYESAIKHFTNAIRNDPQDVDYLIARGTVRMSMEDYEGAYRDFNSAVTKDDESLEAIKWRGFASIELGNQAEGWNDLEAIVENYTDDAQVFYYYGQACVRNENYDDALKFFSHACKLDPEYAEGHFGLGVTLMQMENATAAAEEFSQAMSLDEENADYVFLYGVALCTSGDESGADWIGRASEMEPDNEKFSDAYEQVMDELEST